MSTPIRLQLRRVRGFNLQQISRAANGLAAINCTRLGAHKGLLGNPWKICQDGMSRADVVERHRAWLAGELAPASIDGELRAQRRQVLRLLPALAGFNLACSCRLEDPCHVDTLLALIQRRSKI